LPPPDPFATAAGVSFPENVGAGPARDM
jgi:hypothetical protein